jgi:two-component system, sensor histidine kinase
MEKPKKHPKEELRLKALQKTMLLDSSKDKDFDDLTFVASQLFQVPIVLISLVDENRQWFKSKIGLDIMETPKDISFCAHAILDEKVTVINNAETDTRFSDNPLVTSGIKIRFYAGSPIFEPDTKLPIGTLCLIDSKPRDLKENEVAALIELTRQVEKLIELRFKIHQNETTLNQTIFQRVAFNQMGEGVVIQDINGKIVDFNPSAIKVLGMTADQLLGKTSLDKDWNTIRENGENYPGVEHPSMITLKTGAPCSGTMGVNIKDNQTKWISVSSNPVYLEKNNEISHVVTTFKDITQEKQNQIKLIQAAKMTSLGEMTSQMAHEINSPLAVINISSYQALNALNQKNIDKNYIQSRLQTIDSTVQRISAIIKGLRSIVRQADNDPKQLISIKEVLENTLIICQDKFNKNGITIKQELTEDYKIFCIPALVSQVFLNLLNNSFDAIKNNDEKWIKITVEKKSNYKLIKFIDSGNGIPEKIQNHLMESFFTTKPAGEGIGLGLSICKGVINSLNGKIYYETFEGHTCFCIELPAKF